VSNLSTQLRPIVDNVLTACNMIGYDGHRAVLCCRAVVGLAVVPRGRLTLTLSAARDRRLCTSAVATANTSTHPDFVQALCEVDTNFFPQSARVPTPRALSRRSLGLTRRRRRALGAEIGGVTEGVCRVVTSRSRRMWWSVRSAAACGGSCGSSRGWIEGPRPGRGRLRARGGRWMVVHAAMSAGSASLGRRSGRRLFGSGTRTGLGTRHRPGRRRNPLDTPALAR